MTGGMMAALMMESEMSGLAAINVKAILAEHCVTLESLQAYTPVLKDLLEFPGAQDKMDEFFM